VRRVGVGVGGGRVSGGKKRGGGYGGGWREEEGIARRSPVLRTSCGARKIIDLS